MTAISLDPLDLAAGCRRGHLGSGRRVIDPLVRAIARPDDAGRDEQAGNDAADDPPEELVEEWVHAGSLRNRGSGVPEQTTATPTTARRDGSGDRTRVSGAGR